MRQSGRRARILKAAAKLFADKGYDRTGVRDVAERVGLLSGSLYAHFESKEEMLFELISRAFDDAIRALTPVVESDLTPPDKVRQAFRVYLGMVSRNYHLSKILFQWRSLRPPRRERIRAKRVAYGEMWQRIIDDGIMNGDFSGEDPLFARILILSAANWTHTWFRPSGAMSPDEVADRFTDMVLRGLSKRTVA
jgi:TetR/AcrR family transcriptional regulator, cholesterol catabolism regulator